jgi:GNAT superfamily N-acetyltransferase
MHSEQISLRPATQADSQFVYQVKKAALGPYIEQVFGWDEEQQQAFHAEEYQVETTQIVLQDSQPIGWVASHQEHQNLIIDHVYLLPEYQGKGIGKQLLATVLAEADVQGYPSKLDVLKVNPARRLYERNGFVIVGENEHFYHMERQPLKQTSMEQFK